VRGAAGARIDAGDGWSWWSEASDQAAFHAVTAGTAWLGVPGHDPLQLLPGDVVLLPAGTAHALAGDVSVLRRTGPGTQGSYVQTGATTVRIGSGEARTRVLCAHYRHDPAVSTQVLGLLPEVVHVRDDHAGGGLDTTLRLLAQELSGPRLATTLVVDRLVDVLLVQLLRVWLESDRDREAPGAWLGVLRDPVVSAAVAYVHANPAWAWTAESLAREVSVSRATLVRRFDAVLGETPATYITRWRMDLASRRLRDSDQALGEIARSVGYTSVPAFNRAFARVRGLPPGSYRRSTAP
jgi:AraC-like DNA-binding protein